MQQAVDSYEKRLEQVTLSLAEFKHRALTAELQLEETSSNSSRVEELERKLKEKTVLNDKLRHEGKKRSVLPLVKKLTACIILVF